MGYSPWDHKRVVHNLPTKQQHTLQHSKKNIYLIVTQFYFNLRAYSGSLRLPPDVNSQVIGKDLMLGKIEGKRRRGCQKMSWLDSITNLMDMNLSKLWEMVKDRVAWHAAVHVVTKCRTQLRD